MRRFAIALAAAALLAGAAAPAQDQEPPAPTATAALPALGDGDWSVGPRPNGDGLSIAVRWKQAASEKAYEEALARAIEEKRKLAEAGETAKADAIQLPLPPEHEYVVSVSGTPDGPFVDVGKASSMGAMAREALDILGPGVRGSTEHFLSVVLTSVAQPRELAAAAFALRKPEAERSEAEKGLIEKYTRLLGEKAVADAKALIDKAEVRNERELLSHHIEGYLGTGGLVRIILDRDWRVKLSVRAPGVEPVPAGAPKTVRASASLFHTGKLNNFVVMLVLGALVLGFIRHARKNPNLFLRRIGGLDAVDEALGRATEMGKPVLFVHGLNTMDSISTVAAVSILGEVAKKVARYDSKLLCVNNDPIVLAVSQETVKEGYLDAGRPDAYNPDDVFFVAAEQFSYVAAVDGIMVRQKPAANLYCGYFYAESLILAETGATTGAIQIAATDSYTQLPFFVTTCDYTLMGEELYAAAAYLSRDPLMLGSLKGQDVGKAAIAVLLLVGTVLSSVGVMWVTQVLLRPS